MASSLLYLGQASSRQRASSRYWLRAQRVAGRYGLLATYRASQGVGWSNRPLAKLTGEETGRRAAIEPSIRVSGPPLGKVTGQQTAAAP